MNKPLTLGGKLVIGRYGLVATAVPVGAPSSDVGATLAVVPEGSDETPVAVLTMPVALDPSITSVRIVFVGFDGDGRRAHASWPVPGGKLAEMKAAAGDYLLADFGDLAGDVANVVRARIILGNSSGEGYPAPLPLDYGGEVVIAPSFSLWELVGTGVAGTEHTVSWAVDGIPAPVVAVRWLIDDVEVATGTTYDASDAADGDTLVVEITATNVAGSETVSESLVITVPAVVVAPEIAVSIAGGQYVGQTLTATVTLIAGTPAPTYAYQWTRDGADISGATAATYALAPADDGKTIRCRVVATNSAGSDTKTSAGVGVSLVPIKPEITVAIAGGQYVGETLTATVTLVSGYPAPTYSYQWTRDGVDIAGATAETYVLVVGDAGKTVRCRATALNSAGSDAETSTGIAVTAEPAKPLDADWKLRLTQNSDGTTRVDEVLYKDSLAPQALWWTTGQDAYLDSAEWPVGREATTRGATVIEDGITWRRFAVADAIDATGKNYRVFGATEDGRRSRFGIYVEVGGAISPLSNRKTIEGSITPPSGVRSWWRMVLRPQAESDRGEFGGNGMQFPRSFDCDGDYFMMGYDITSPTESHNFGDDWNSVTCDGLMAARSFDGLKVDGKYVHVQTGQAWAEQVGDYKDFAGAYRYNRETKKWQFIKPLIYVYGTNTSPTRYNCQYIDIQPGSGTGPDTRTIWQIYAPAAYLTKEAGFSTIQLMRSTNGGASYSDVGDALGTATYGIPYGITAEASGNVTVFGSKGAWRRRTDTGAWVKASFPSGAGTNPEITLIEVIGSKVYAGVRGKGIYTADVPADQKDPLSFSLFYSYANLLYFSVCPTDTNRILVCGKNQSDQPKWTHNANAATPTWSNITIQNAPGSEAWENKIYGNQAWFKWHKTDKNKVIAMRYHHIGKSVDGGKTVFWASRGFDYSGVRSVGYSLTTHKKMFVTMVDRITAYSDNGGLFFFNNGLGDRRKEVFDVVKPGKTPALNAAGGLILENGQHTGLVAQVGPATGDRTPVIFKRTVNTKASSGQGNGTMTGVSVSPGVPGGEYVWRCTTAGTTFTGTGPGGVNLGTVTVGTNANVSIPSGGTIALKINAGSTAFQVGKTFTIDVNPVGDFQVLAPASRSRGDYGAIRPTNKAEGFSGRHYFIMNSSGVVSLDRTSAYEVFGYGGAGGKVCFGLSGSKGIRRSTDNGESWGSSNWWSGRSGTGVDPNEDNFSSPGLKVAIASWHNDQRCYIGSRTGKVVRIQNGVGVEIFSIADWMNAIGAPAVPGYSLVGSRRAPCVTGLTESFYDANVIFAAFMTAGMRMQVLRCSNALASSGWVWEDVTKDGLDTPPSGIYLNPLTDEPILTGDQGPTVYDVGDAWRSAKGIVPSISKTLAASRGQFAYMGV